MIREFAHKGLRKLFETGSAAGIRPDMAPRLLRMLDRLNASSAPQDMDVPGWRFHSLTGDRTGTYSVSVNANWRLTFTMTGADAIAVNLEDYH